MAKLKDDQIIAILTNRIAKSTGMIDNTPTNEREEVIAYYKAELPKVPGKGRSRYVSRDVFDAVEGMKAQLMNTFTGQFQPVRFMASGPNDVREADIATVATNYVIDVQNDGFQIKHDLIHDGLIARMGVAKVWYEQSEEEAEEVFTYDEDDPQGTHDAIISALGQMPSTSSVSDLEMDEDSGLMKSAKITHKKDTSQVKIDAIPPEEFGVSPGTRRLVEADIVYHRVKKTKSELIAMGFDPDIVADLPPGREWLYLDEQIVRSGEFDSAWWENGSDDEESGREVELFECYTKIDMTGTKASDNRKLWKILLAGGKILDKEQVQRLPFVTFSPLPASHTIWGENFARNLIQTQNAATAIHRSIIDHTVITTNPRWMVMRNGLPNASELMENRIGGIVNVTKPDAIAPLPQSNLNPYAFQSIQYLSERRDETSGMPSLTQGLNKDALSKQNSAEMVENIMNAAQLRQKVIALRFSETLKDLYLMVWQLLVENEAAPFFVQVAGDYVQVDPSNMATRKDMSIDFCLGYGEKQREADKYRLIDQYLSAQPGLAHQYTPQCRYTVISRALDGMNIKDAAAILAPPNAVPPPQPNPAQQLEAAEVQAKIRMMDAQAQSMTMKTQMEAQKLQLQHQIDIMEMQLKLQALQSKNSLESRKLDHTEVLQAAELRMAQATLDAGRMQGEAMVSPR